MTASPNRRHTAKWNSPTPASISAIMPRGHYRHRTNQQTRRRLITHGIELTPRPGPGRPPPAARRFCGRDTLKSRDRIRRDRISRVTGKLLRFRYYPVRQCISALGASPITDKDRYCALVQPFSRSAPPHRACQQTWHAVRSPWSPTSCTARFPTSPH
jgi:hypothetical protein